MALKKITPNQLEFAPIGENVAKRIKIPAAKERVIQKFSDEGMENSIISPENSALTVGCGRFVAGAMTAQEIPVSYEEVLAVLEGSVTLTSGGEEHTAQAGEFFYIEAGSPVRFSSKDGCLLLFVTCPPVWSAFEKAFKAGKL